MPLVALPRSDDQVQQQQEPSSPATPRTSELSPTRKGAPLDLQPVALAPERLSAGVIPSGFLETVQRVEINETRARDGETFFVVDVFLHHFNTRLPANLRYLRRAALESDSAATPVKGRKPDYQIERRFTDFCDLRRQVYEVACLNPQVRCTSCDEFIVYVRFKLRQPRPVMHLVTTGCTAARKEILAAFVNDFLRMALNRDKQNRKCESHGFITMFLEGFLRHQQQDTDSSFSSQQSWY